MFKRVTFIIQQLLMETLLCQILFHFMYCMPYVGKFSCTQNITINEYGYIFSHDVVIRYVFYYFYYMLIVCTHLLTHNRITDTLNNQEIMKLEYAGYSTSFCSMTEDASKTDMQKPQRKTTTTASTRSGLSCISSCSFSYSYNNTGSYSPREQRWR